MICVFQVVDYSKALALTEKNNTCTRKNAQVVTSRQRTCSHVVPTSCQQDVFALLVPSLLTTCYTRLLRSTDLLQVVPKTCYRPAIQQFVNKLRVTTL
jgi:hypothetical protein